MTPLTTKSRFRSLSDPGVRAGQAGPLPQPSQAPRLRGVQRSVSGPIHPLAQRPSSPRLDRKSLDHKGLDYTGLDGGAESPHDPHEPYLTEEFPSMEHSPFLLDRACADRKDMVLVKQSEGAASATLPLVSWGFKQCSALFIRNLETGKTWLGHHDSGSRAHWTSNPDGERPVSPATPRRGLLGRDRFGYEAFMKEPGAKTVLLVESEQGYDRREVLQQIVARGAVEVLPLTLELGADPQDAEWHIAYDPKTDHMAIYLEETLQSSVQHFSGLLTKGQTASRPDSKQGGQKLDIVNGLPVYKERLAKATLDSNTHAIISACLSFVELRNTDPDLALDALAKLIQLQGVPMDLLGMRIHPLDKDSPVVEILTGLVDKCLSQL